MSLATLKRTGRGGATTPSVPKAPASSAPNEKRFIESRARLADLRASRRLRGILLLCVGTLIGALMPFHSISSLRSFVSNDHVQTTRAIEGISKRVDQYASTCASTNSCKTFSFPVAQDVAMIYATQCFTFNADAKIQDQPARLKYAGGPADCGWNTAGAGTATVFPDASAQQTIPDAQAQPRSDLGLVGMKVQMLGQPDLIRYIVVVSTQGGAAHVVSPGAFYSTYPNTVISSCQIDSSSTGNDIQARLQSMEAGRTGEPNVDPTDYLQQGLTIARFTPSVTAIKVESVAICRGSDPSHVDVVARELFSGPVPGAKFEFVNGYKMSRDAATKKWFVAGWGPVVDSTLGTF